MTSIYRALSILVLFALTACISGTTVGEHVADKNYVGNPRRIFVVNTLDLRAFGPDAGYALKAEPGRCGIASEIVELEGLQLDAGPNLTAEAKSFKPGMILILQLQTSLCQAGAAVQDTYLLTVTDVAQKHEVWKGMVSWYANRFVADRTQVGRDFAAMIVRTLAHERILKSCPASVAHQI